MTKVSVLSLLLFAIAATPSLAESPEPAADRIVVATADLDLGSETGQRLLDRRLTQAVIEACGTASNVDLVGSNDVRKCRDDTRASIAASRDRLVDLASRSSPIVIAAVR